MKIFKTLTRMLAIKIGVAVLVATGSVATAAEFQVELVRVTNGSPNGSSDAVTLSTSGSWVYDDVAGTVTLQGSQVVDFKLGPFPGAAGLFTHNFAGVVLDLSAQTVTGASYECIPGSFGDTIGVNLCANSLYGANFINETTVDYSSIPGVRNITGDDSPAGAAQQLSDYSVALNSFNGSQLIVESAAWTGNPGSAGIQLEFVVSGAPPVIDVPNFKGQLEADAFVNVVNAGLTVGAVSTQHSELYPAGTVAVQTPAACTSCALLNDPVDLVISLGPEPIPTVAERLDTMISTVNGLGLNFWNRLVLNGLLYSAKGTLEWCEQDLEELLADARRPRRVEARYNARCRDDRGATVASQKLETFVWIVDWFRGNALTNEQADDLVAQAQAVIDQLFFVPPTGLVTILSNGEERIYYMQVPSGYSQYDDSKPIVFAFHGTNGTYNNWFESGFYGDNLRESVGDEAIIILPQAGKIATGINQWDFAIDFQYFQDVLADVEERLAFDSNRIFVTGHSSGGAFSHEIGCRFGDIVRAVAPSAGGLTSRGCTGSVAVIQFQSEFDEIVPPSVTTPSRDHWILYNGFDLGVFEEGLDPVCQNYDLGGSPYPFQYCLHDETGFNGHRWWAPREGEIIWEFFKNLPDVEPTADHPPGGGNERVEQELPGGTLDMTLRFPNGIGEVYLVTAVLYPENTAQPIFSAPLWFLNLDIDPMGAQAGDDVTYSVSVNLPQDGVLTPIPGNYTLSISAFVVGGGFPIPAAGIDHVGLAQITVTDSFSSIVVPGVLELVPYIN